MSERNTTVPSEQKRFQRHVLVALTVVLVGSATLGGCGKGEEEAAKAKAALSACEQERDAVQQQLNDLKMKLAQALANPGTVEVDPSVLMIDGQPIQAKVQEGTLTQKQVIDVMRRNKGSLRECYTRALKRNSALHHGAITLTLSFKVKNNGKSSAISIRPSRDATMTDCMVKAIKRWPFPSFHGQPVGVESPMTLTPKK